MTYVTALIEGTRNIICRPGNLGHSVEAEDALARRAMRRMPVDATEKKIFEVLKGEYEKCHTQVQGFIYRPVPGAYLPEGQSPAPKRSDSGSEVVPAVAGAGNDAPVPSLAQAATPPRLHFADPVAVDPVAVIMGTGYHPGYGPGMQPVSSGHA